MDIKDRLLAVMLTASTVHNPAIATSTTTSSNRIRSEESNIHVGAIVGGVIGGVVGLLLLLGLGLFLWGRQKRRRRDTARGSSQQQPDTELAVLSDPKTDDAILFEAPVKTPRYSTAINLGDSSEPQETEVELRDALALPVDLRKCR